MWQGEDLEETYHLGIYIIISVSVFMIVCWLVSFFFYFQPRYPPKNALYTPKNLSLVESSSDIELVRTGTSSMEKQKPPLSDKSTSSSSSSSSD